MEGEIIVTGLGLLFFGALFVWLGINGWRHRREERINLIETAILKASGVEELLPRNRWDRIMAYIQPVLMLLFGPAIIFLGLVILLV